MSLDPQTESGHTRDFSDSEVSKCLFSSRSSSRYRRRSENSMNSERRRVIAFPCLIIVVSQGECLMCPFSCRLCNRIFASCFFIMFSCSFCGFWGVMCSIFLSLFLSVWTSNWIEWSMRSNTCDKWISSVFHFCHFVQRNEAFLLFGHGILEWHVSLVCKCNAG